MANSMAVPVSQDRTSQSAWLKLLYVPLIFAISSLGLLKFMKFAHDSLPSDRLNETATLKFPTTFDEAKLTYSTLRAYQENEPLLLLVLFAFAYVYKQTFAIPGSVFLNLLAGALYGVVYGFPLVCLLSASGATCCYLLSACFGREFVLEKFSNKIQGLQQKVDESRNQLVLYLISLRLLPCTPNWLLNIASPIINIPIAKFFLSVFIGLMPYNFLCVQSGSILSELSSTTDIFDYWTFTKLVLLALTVAGFAVWQKSASYRNHCKRS